ncbi:MAG: hypothetical protein ACOX5R_02120 [bacterium]
MGVVRATWFGCRFSLASGCRGPNSDGDEIRVRVHSSGEKEPPRSKRSLVPMRQWVISVPHGGEG